MKNSTKVVTIVVLATLFALSYSVAFAGNENATTAKNMTNVTTNETNVTENMINATENMTNVTSPFAKAKGVVVVKR